MTLPTGPPRGASTAALLQQPTTPTPSENEQLSQPVHRSWRLLALVASVFRVAVTHTGAHDLRRGPPTGKQRSPVTRNGRALFFSVPAAQDSRLRGPHDRN